jgi:glycosyltransferase involved in cell wall biosynthesis
MVSWRASVNNGSLTIAHVLTSLRVGGGERVALLLAERQIELGHRVVVASLEADPGGTMGPDFEAVGATVHRTPKKEAGADPKLWGALGALLRSAHPDVVHTHNAMPQIYAAPPGRLLGARVVHTEHGRHLGSRRYEKLRRLTCRAVHRFVAVSEATADFVRRRRIVADDKIRVILNGTDVRRFARDAERREAIRSRWGVGKDTFVVGTVGRMAEVKNHALLLRALAPLLGDDCVLVVAGDGEMRSATEELVTELGLDDYVRLLGTVRDVDAVMSGLDVFALSSDSEGLPMVLVEAMSASLPVVATAVGGVPRVVREGETGRLVPSGDAKSFRAAVAALRDDAALRGELGQRALAVAEAEYSSQRMTDEYLDAYREA